MGGSLVVVHLFRFIAVDSALCVHYGLGFELGLLWSLDLQYRVQ